MTEKTKQLKGIFDTTDLEKEIEEEIQSRGRGNIADKPLGILKEILKERQRLKAEVEKVYDKMLNEDWTPEQLLVLTHFLKRMGIIK